MPKAVWTLSKLFLVLSMILVLSSHKSMGAQEKIPGNPAVSGGKSGAGTIAAQVTTTDGSVFRGTISGGSVTIKTAFGELKIEGRRIRALSGAALTLDDGSVLQGTLVGGELQVTSPYGFLTIPGPNIQAIQGPQPAQALPPSPPGPAPVVRGEGQAAPMSEPFGQILKGLGLGQQGGLSEAKIASGLKEALQIGTANAVSLTGRPDGYFRNQAIKILMPEQLQTMEKMLRMVGYGPQVDEFVLSMNRAAERAAPFAKQIFWDAIREMSFDDARKILASSDTAATEYFKAKTTDKLVAAFRPVVEQAMNEVGVTRQYKELVGRFQIIPLIKSETVDIDQYVVTKSLDGLFHVLGEEERKIRTNPTARVTDLLKEVFTK